VLKGLTNYHSNEIAVEAASGPIKGLLSRNIYSKGELDNTSKPNRIMSKRQPAREKTPRIKNKELLTLAPGDTCRWEMLKTMTMIMGENQSSQSQVG
jgi:hypothetical protein